MNTVDLSTSTFLIAAADALHSAKSHEDLARMFVAAQDGVNAIEQLNKATLKYSEAARLKLKHEQFVAIIHGEHIHLPASHGRPFVPLKGVTP